MDRNDPPDPIGCGRSTACSQRATGYVAVPEVIVAKKKEWLPGLDSN
jgi:hypothetical protein